MYVPSKFKVKSNLVVKKCDTDFQMFTYTEKQV